MNRNAPASLHQFLTMLDADPPRWEGKALYDPRYAAEYRRHPVHLPHSFLAFMKERASNELKEYVRACLKWHAKTDSAIWRPGWLHDVAILIRKG